jgi:biopolymer transport protein ExbD
MAMAVGPSTSLKADINITPLVDVVLVLLIIFMVITPILQMGYDTKVPPKSESAVTTPSTDQIVLRLEADGRIFINKEEVTESYFPTRLRDVVKGRESRVIFFAASGDAVYDKVLAFMDLCKNNGAANLGIVLEEMGGA